MEFEFEEIRVDDGAVDTTAEADSDQEFSLFAGSGPQHIVVEEPSPVEGEQDDNSLATIQYIPPERPHSYYVQKTSELEKQQYKESAISGESVLDESNTPYEGMRMPWRVLDYTALAKIQDKEIAHAKKRRRPGKKTRAARKLKQSTSNSRQKWYPRVPQYGPSRLYGAFF